MPPKQPVRYLVEPTGDGRWRLSAVQGGILKKTKAEAEDWAREMAKLSGTTAVFGTYTPED